MRRKPAVLIILFAMASFLAAQEQPAPAALQQDAQVQNLPQFTKPQLEQLVASIALYPDDLLAQVLAASTYPVDIVEAARFIKRNPSLNMDDINNELKAKKWDPSVKGLVFFPELLAKMNDNMDWTKDLGDAFLTQPKDVMDTIQVMRGKAQAAGYLNSDPNQKVTTNTEGQTEIQNTNPETVYVQDYQPSTVYGTDYDDHNDCWGYSGINSAPAWPWRGGYAAAWALGYRCGWGNNSGLAYNSNYYNGSFYKNNLQNANIDPANKTWTHDNARSRPFTADTQKAAKQLQTDSRTAQNFNKGDSAASKELKQNIQEGDRTQAAKSAIENSDRAQAAKAEAASRDLRQSAPEGARAEAAKSALQNADRSQVAARVDNSARAQNAKTAAQARPQQNVQSAMSGSRNANLERTYSNRGAQSRTVSAHTTNKGGAVKSHAGSAPKGGGAARGGAGAGRR